MSGQNVNEHSINQKSEPPHSSSDGTGKDKANRRLNLPVSETIFGGMTGAELVKAREKERQLIQQDVAMELTKNKGNILESFVYDTRNKSMPKDIGNKGFSSSSSSSSSRRQRVRQAEYF
ncbi:unnamed protein product [Trifolium pratense]|uniref:Uncharacterized protein n=1 Tax=Trifolium pratense TaxID=57577 RepID=A0ACB0IP58_TRIPR|nr:unnamed protein product [Trifolium pratense]